MQQRPVVMCNGRRFTDERERQRVTHAGRQAYGLEREKGRVVERGGWESRQTGREKESEIREYDNKHILAEKNKTLDYGNLKIEWSSYSCGFN